MTKDDLKPGMGVLLRDNTFGIILNNRIIFPNGYIEFHEINSNLTVCNFSKKAFSDLDIMSVYTPNDSLHTNEDLYNVSCWDVIWARKEKVSMSISEIENKLGLRRNFNY